ncbi:MAG: hypothetical protein ACK5N8_02130 [Alphaproteobacteria bacterium]
MVSRAYKIAKDFADKNTIGVLAKKLGYARSSTNLYLLGQYNGNIKYIENKILTVFINRIHCPYRDKVISKEDCEDTCKSTNTSSPALFKMQQFCKTCPFQNTTKEEFKKQFTGEN